MTLPDSEIKRIERCNDGHEIGACVAEASLWFKRMVILLEEQAMIFIGKTSWKYFASTGRWSSPHHKEHLTTPELIELFINSLNEGK